MYLTGIFSTVCIIGPSHSLLDMMNNEPANTTCSNFDSATVSFSFGTIFQQQLRNVVIALQSSSL
jgi:hypothetical protein